MPQRYEKILKKLAPTSRRGKLALKCRKIRGLLHREGIEAAVDDGHRAGDEGRGVANEILDGAAELLGASEPLEGGLADHVGAALRERAVGIGEQGAILIGEEEARGDGVDADAGGELGGHLSGEELGEIGDAGFGGGISHHAGEGAEGGHGGEIDDGALAGCHHRAHEHLRGDDGAHEVHSEHLLEGLDVDVEESFVGRNGGTGLIASGGIEQGIDAAIAGHDGIAGGLHGLYIHHIGGDKHRFAGAVSDLFDYGIAFGLTAAEDHHFCAFIGEVGGDAAAQHSGASGDHHHFIFYGK